MGNKDRLNKGELTILSAQGAAGAGTAKKVSNTRHIIVSVATDGGGTADLTLKCQGSIQQTAPTWTSAQSVTNHYDFLHMWDLEDATGLDGDTGLVLSGADDYRLFMVNVDGLEWVNFRVTAWAAGTVTVKIRPFSNL